MQKDADELNLLHRKGGFNYPIL